jgi:hypothetical protein
MIVATLVAALVGALAAPVDAVVHGASLPSHPHRRATWGCLTANEQS